MTNKKIPPVTFSDETVEKKEQVGVKSINRAAPGSGSGSGSGSGGSTLGADSGSFIITSKYGCSWNVECRFVWNASWNNDFTSISLSVHSMDLVGSGNSTGEYTAKNFQILYTIYSKCIQ